jgi:hypothetical protein
MDIGLYLGIKLDNILYEVDKGYAPQKFSVISRKNNIPSTPAAILPSKKISPTRLEITNVLLPAYIIMSESNLQIYI